MCVRETEKPPRSTHAWNIGSCCGCYEARKIFAELEGDPEKFRGLKGSMREKLKELNTDNLTKQQLRVRQNVGT